MDKPCGEEREVKEQMSCVREEVEEGMTSRISGEQDEVEATEAVGELTQDRCVKLEAEGELSLLLSNAAAAEAEQLRQQSLASAAQNMQLEEMEALKAQVINEASELSAKICELESDLNQSWALRADVEAQLNDSNQRCDEHENRANALHERNLELEELVRSSLSRIDEIGSTQKSQITHQLEQERAVQVAAEWESGLETQNQQMSCRVKELESAMEELEKELFQEETRARSIFERNQELEELLMSIQFKAEDSERRVGELEFLLESEKSRINDFEKRCGLAEEKTAQYADMLSSLTTQLEVAVQKNREIEDQLNFVKSNYDDTQRKLKEQSLEVESVKEDNACQVEQLHATISELESALTQSLLIRSQLEAEMKTVSERCGQRVLELEDSVRFWKSRIEDEFLEAENEKRLAESLEAIAADKRVLEEAVHDTMAKHEVEKFVQNRELMEKGCQVEQLQTTIFDLESALSESLLLRSQLETEMETITERCGQRIMELEDTIRFWESRVEESERRESRIREVNADTEAEFLEAIAADKRNLEEAVNDTIAKLEVDNLVQNEELMAILKSKDSELDSLLDYERQEVEAQKVHVDETMQELSLKELQVKELNEYLEEQVKSHEIKLVESGESTRAELELYVTKVQDQEHVIQELEAKLGLVESRLNDLQQELYAAVADKEASMKVTQELSSEKQSFQTMVATTMEEKQLLHEANRDAEIELQRVKNELERQLKEYEESNEGLRGELENLKLEAAQNEVEHLVLAAGVMFEKQQEEKMLESGEKVQKGLEEPGANAELGKSSPEDPIKNIRVAVGVGLVSVAAAILAGKK